MDCVLGAYSVCSHAGVPFILSVSFNSWVIPRVAPAIIEQQYRFQRLGYLFYLNLEQVPHYTEAEFGRQYYSSASSVVKSTLPNGNRVAFLRDIALLPPYTKPGVLQAPPQLVLRQTEHKQLSIRVTG